MKRVWAPITAGFLLLLLVLPQLALAEGPSISTPVVQVVTSTTATIYWTTNTTSNSVVRYGTSKPPSQETSDSTQVTTHFITLTGLSPGTKYWFEVRSTDASGTNFDNNGGEYYEFTTLSPAAYSITLDHACGVCGDLWQPTICDEVIGVTAIVAAAGEYRICWDSRAATTVVYGGTFSTTGPGTYTLTFKMPEAKRGIHKVYLTNNFYDDLGPNAVKEFTVNPSVKINPEEGPVGTQVTLNGYGFDASQQIQVKFNDTVITPSTPPTASPVGSWTVTYTIPDTPGGGYTFNVGPPNSAEVWVSKYFKVTPKITANPSSGKVGQKIAISGTGFASNEKNIQVIFEGEVRAAGIAANEKGSWSADIIVPPRQGGTYTIGASGSVTRARDVSPVDFILSAGIFVEPSLAHVGDTITVKGGGFRPGETGIRVTFGGQFVTSTITARSNGSWEGSFVLPPSPYGDNTVTARGDVTSDKTAILTVKARIESLSPNEGAPGDTVTLTGSGFGSSKTLIVTIGAGRAKENLQSQYNGNVAISFRVPSRADGVAIGTQTLKVDDGAGGFDEVDFTVKEKILSIVPLPISPKDNTLRSGEVTFSWQGMTGSTGYTYTMEISKTAGGGSIGPPKSGIAESSYTLAESEALSKGTYYWRVKIVDNYGNEGPWSDSIEFKVSPIPTWVWVLVGLAVLVVLLVVAYRETKFKVTQ